MTDHLVATTSSHPDYHRYSLEQLERARRSIAVDRFPERTQLLDILIADRRHQKELASIDRPSAIEDAGASASALTNVRAEAHVRPLAHSPLRGNPLLRRGLGMVTVWGGLSGAITFLVFAVQAGDWLGVLFALAFVLLYGWSTWAGVLLMEDRPGAVHHNQMLWLFQVPVLMSPWLNFSYASGAIAAFWIQFSEFRLGFNLHLGSQGQLLVNTPAQGFALGVNFFAVLIIGLLVMLEDSADSLPHPETPAEPNAQENVIAETVS